MPSDASVNMAPSPKQIEVVQEELVSCSLLE